MIENYELKKHTTFKIGGCAKRAFFPKTTEEFTKLVNCSVVSDSSANK